MGHFLYKNGNPSPKLPAGSGKGQKNVWEIRPRGLLAGSGDSRTIEVRLYVLKLTFYSDISEVK